jgi:two-component system, NtrC family, sensor kinase
MLKRVNIFWKLSAAFIIIILLALLILNYSNRLIDDYYSGDRIDDNSSKGYVQFALTVLMIIVISSFATLLFVRLFLRPPLHRLVHGMDKLADKEFDFRLDEDEMDEFASLASSFNDMADMLASSLNELNKNKDYLESILESSADIIITVNASGKIQTINSGAEQALGYKRFDLIGKPVEMLFENPEDRKKAIARLGTSDSVPNYETRFVTKDGQVTDVLLTLSRLRNPAGDVIGTIGISKDITEVKSLQKQLIQSERYAAIGQVFTGIQHTMKNMLNACKGGAYMVKIGLAKDNMKMLTEGWDIVKGGIDSLTAMSMDMLKYVKEFKPTLTQVDIIQTLTEISNLIKQTANDDGIGFHLDMPPALPSLLCDEKMIHSAVMDIVSNALDACRWKDYIGDEKPEVSLSAYLTNKDRESVIEVKDNGCGMTEDVKQRIFTPFFSTKSKAGTGLGLSITSRMIEVHGGKIDVESEPNLGTIFRIVLRIRGTNTSKEKDYVKKGSSS